MYGWGQNLNNCRQSVTAACGATKHRLGGVLGEGCSLQENFTDLNLKEAVLKHFNMIISLLYINTIICIILVWRLTLQNIRLYVNTKIKPTIICQDGII